MQIGFWAFWKNVMSLALSVSGSLRFVLVYLDSLSAGGKIKQH